MIKTSNYLRTTFNSNVVNQKVCLPRPSLVVSIRAYCGQCEKCLLPKIGIQVVQIAG